MMAKPTKTLEVQITVYPMIQFVLITVNYDATHDTHDCYLNADFSLSTKLFMGLIFCQIETIF